MTSAEQNRIERRCGQRFPFQLPVVLRVPGEPGTGTGFTQDLSARGATVWTDFPVLEGQVVEITLVMPSEITLAEDMNVCCRAHVLRRQQSNGNKPSLALRIEHYDFLYREVPGLEEHTIRGIPSRDR